MIDRRSTRWPGAASQAEQGIGRPAAFLAALLGLALVATACARAADGELVLRAVVAAEEEQGAVWGYMPGDPVPDLAVELVEVDRPTALTDTAGVARLFGPIGEYTVTIAGPAPDPRCFWTAMAPIDIPGTVTVEVVTVCAGD